MRTSREQRALEALADAAAEVASNLSVHADAEKTAQYVMDPELADALAALYRANEEWQDTQERAGVARLKRQHALATTSKGEVLECVLSRAQLKKMARGEK